MEEVLQPDICVIGAGSAGLSVAAGAPRSASPSFSSKGRMGGDCLNYGCVPSKALIAAARHARPTAAQFGVTAGEPVVDFKAVHAHIARRDRGDRAERFRRAVHRPWGQGHRS